MSCAFALEAPFCKNNHVLTKSTKNPNPQNISFSSQLTKSKISLRNGYGRNRVGSNTSGIKAVYTPTTESRETLYELLGIKESGSTFSDIKKAYKYMARKYHPDVSPPDRVDENTKKFIMVKEAYETLSSPHSKALYDRNLAMGLSYHHYNEVGFEKDDTWEWRNRWNSQLDELKENKKRTERMTWGARMRNQR